MEVTSHPLATAFLHILEPRKPFPPATTKRFFTACAILDSGPLFIDVCSTVETSYQASSPASNSCWKYQSQEALFCGDLINSPKDLQYAGTGEL
jgi:hypothetical protein